VVSAAAVLPSTATPAGELARLAHRLQEEWAREQLQIEKEHNRASKVDGVWCCSSATYSYEMLLCASTTYGCEMLLGPQGGGSTPVKKQAPTTPPKKQPTPPGRDDVSEEGEEQQDSEDLADGLDDAHASDPAPDGDTEEDAAHQVSHFGTPQQLPALLNCSLLF
jgi:hypothetical protein